MIAEISELLLQLSKLYQVPNFTGENAVLLSKWIIANYEFEPLEVVIDCLVNPPHTGEKNWRLTPDTIQQWLSIRLEEQAEKREREYQKEKERQRQIESVPNFPDFDKLFAGTWYDDVKKKQAYDEAKMQEIRDNWIKSRQ